VIGYAVFNEIPTVWTWAGAGVVVASTLFITLREQRLARSAKLSAGADPER
jgi:drug/metabolite transporter (DMT)-like permease